MESELDAFADNLDSLINVARLESGEPDISSVIVQKFLQVKLFVEDHSGV